MLDYTLAIQYLKISETENTYWKLFWKQNILNPWYKFFNKNVFYKIIVPKALNTYSSWTHISIGHVPNNLIHIDMCPTPNALQCKCVSYFESATQSPKSS